MHNKIEITIIKSKIGSLQTLLQMTNISIHTVGVPVVSPFNFFETMRVPKIAEKGCIFMPKRGPCFHKKGVF